jgi:hypothetical protein
MAMKQLLKLRGGCPDFVGWTGSAQAAGSELEVADDAGLRRTGARVSVRPAGALSHTLDTVSAIQPRRTIDQYAWGNLLAHIAGRINATRITVDTSVGEVL